MKREELRTLTKDSRVFDAVNRKSYVIDMVDHETSVATGTATKYVNGEPVKTTVTITELNCEAFILEEKAIDKTVYSPADLSLTTTDLLVKGYEPVALGKYAGATLIAGVEGGYVLDAGDKVIFYRPALDSFKTLYRKAENEVVQVVSSSENAVVLAVNEIETKTDEKGKEHSKIVEARYVVIVGQGKTFDFYVEGFQASPELVYESASDGDFEYLFRLDTNNEFEPVAPKFMWLRGNAEQRVSKGELIDLYGAEATGVGYIGSSDRTALETPVIFGDDILVIGSHEIRSSAVNTLKSYRCVVSSEKSGDAYTVVLADKEYRTATIVRTKTADRGYLVSVK